MIRRWLALVALALPLASPALADLARLDARARVALAKLRAGAPPRTLIEAREGVNEAGDLDVFVIGDVPRGALAAAGARIRSELPGLSTAFVPAGAIERVAALPGVVRVRGAAPVEPELDASVPATGAHALRGPGPAFEGSSGAGVLVGIVDSGVDHGHGDFRDAAGRTRIVRLWDQTISGAAPAGHGYGAEWTAEQIDAGSCSSVDVSGHGTHVLGIAAGDGSETGGGVPAFTYAGMAPRADLVVVKAISTDTGILDAVRYCFDVAAARGQSAVVNLSAGTHFGPHDGTSALEAGLAALCGPGRIVVKSAGNDRGQPRHAQVFAAGAGSSVTLSVNGSAPGRSIKIDGWYESTEDLAVRLTTPGGVVIGPIARGAANAGPLGAPTPSGNVHLENGVTVSATGDREVHLVVDVQTGQNMNGTWTFTFIPVALGAANGEVDLWRYASSAGVTANFSAGNQPFDELISEPGNAEEVVTVAAWVTKRSWIGCNGEEATSGTPEPGSLASYSSPGPTRDGRAKPDLAAPGSSIASAVTHDVAQLCPAPPTASPLLADGPSHVMSSGTSMAAPHVTGAVALLLARFGPMTPSEVKAHLRDHALADSFTTAVWNRDWGWGKLFLEPQLLAAPAPRDAGGFGLRTVAPNPTHGAARVVFALPRGMDVRLSVLDVQGRRVAWLAKGPHRAGRHEILWDGRATSAPAGAGLYFVLLETPGARTLRRLVLTR